MEWTINTGMVGEVKTADLRKTLEASRDHWLKSQAEYAGSQVADAMTGNAGKPGEVKPDYTAVAAASAKATEAFKAKAATLADQMDAGIDAACALAELCGDDSLVTVSVNGHDDLRHRSGVAQRVSVTVDKVWDESWK